MVCILIDHRNDVNMLKTQSFEHFDVICMVDKSTSHIKLLSICYFPTIDNFDVYFRWRFSERRARRKEESKLRHHHVISMVCALSGAHCNRNWKPMDAGKFGYGVAYGRPPVHSLHVRWCQMSHFVLAQLTIPRQILCEPRRHFISRLVYIIVLNRTDVDSDWRFDNLCGGHLQSQIELYHVSWWY